MPRGVLSHLAALEYAIENEPHASRAGPQLIIARASQQAPAWFWRGVGQPIGSGAE
jgi:hypothetical protein